MARITVYEATDGSLHRDRKEYLRHESNLLVAKKLVPVLENIVDDNHYENEDERAEAVAALYDIVVYGIGLNTLRDLFNLQFKPGAEEGDVESASPTEAPTAAPAQANGQDVDSDI